MCNQERVMSLVELAKKQETEKPKESAKNYLQAANILLEESKKHPKKEEDYIAVANKLYKKAKKLKKKQFFPTKDNSITFDDIGGLQELKEQIRFKIIEPFKKPELFKHYGKSAGGGILMYGPPGCGKSLIAKATGNEAKVNFIHVKGSDLKSKFVGEAEKNIEELFQQARKSQPTIIFFDEFESVGMDRTDSHSHERSAVAQLLTEMDGMEAKDQQILLLAATNEPWSIDPALRREGRFGRTIYVPPPDIEGRKAIFQIHLKERPTEELDYELLAELTEGLSGADIKAVCEMATDIPLRESLETGVKRDIKMEDTEEAITKISSVVQQWMQKAKDQIKKRELQDYFKELEFSKEKAVITN
jgi:transitional endoplasmic reticulum ATPase